jgi:starch phosphorylase
MIGEGAFSPDQRDRFLPILRSLTDGGDHFMVTADFEDYVRVYGQALGLYRNPSAWAEKAIVNTASMGWFSSDRTVAEYAEDIWGVKALLPRSDGGSDNT